MFMLNVRQKSSDEFQYRTLSSVLSDASQTTAAFVSDQNPEGWETGENCMNGSMGLRAIGWVAGGAVGELMTILILYCCCCAKEKAKEDQDPEHCTCYNYLLWVHVACYSQQYWKEKSSLSICLAVSEILFLIGSVFSFGVGIFHDGPCTDDDQASIAIYLLMMLFSLPIIILGTATLCPCVHFGNRYPLVFEHATQGTTTIQQPDGSIVTVPTLRPTFFRHSAAYIRIHPFLGVLILTTGTYMLTYSVAGFFSYSAMSKTYHLMDRLQKGKVPFTVANLVYGIVELLLLVGTCGCLSCACCPAKTGDLTREDSARIYYALHPNQGREDQGDTGLFPPSYAAPNTNTLQDPSYSPAQPAAESAPLPPDGTSPAPLLPPPIVIGETKESEQLKE